ncbi:MAG: hypothetical protein ACAH83_20220 [Alphaproteobacteria bacterium]
MPTETGKGINERFKTSADIATETWLTRVEQTLTKSFQDALEENERSGSLSSALDLVKIAEARAAVSDKLKTIDERATQKMLDWHFPH